MPTPSTASSNSLPITEIVLVLAAHSVELGRTLVRDRQYRKVSEVCAGGARRQDSVRAGLDALQPCDWVMVHDGARPGLDAALLQRGLDTVTGSEYGSETEAAIAGVPVKDTIKVISPEGDVTATPPRETLWAAKPRKSSPTTCCNKPTPSSPANATDDAMMVESLGHKVRMFLGSYENLKVTTPEDLVVVAAVLRGRIKLTEKEAENG